MPGSSVSRVTALTLFDGCQVTFSTDNDVLKFILNLMYSKRELVRWQLQLSKFDFDVVHCTCIRYQSADAFWRLKTTRTEQTPIEDQIPVLRNTGPLLLKKGETVMYIQDYDVLNDKEGIGIPEVYDIATSTDTQHYTRLITGQEYIHEQPKDSYCRKAKSTVELLRLTIN